MKKPKKKTRSRLVKDLDMWFSRYIRQKYSDILWISCCYTCSNKWHWKDMQNWHFVSRANYKYRWDEHNCRVQCYACNIIRSWNYKVYTLKMIEEYGKEKIEDMINDKELTKIKTYEIEEKIEYYKNIVKDC